jgi:hypothetical protein
LEVWRPARIAAESLPGSDDLIDAGDAVVEEVRDAPLLDHLGEQQRQLVQVFLLDASIKRGVCPDEQVVLVAVWLAPEQVMKEAGVQPSLVGRSQLIEVAESAHPGELDLGLQALISAIQVDLFEVDSWDRRVGV